MAGTVKEEALKLRSNLDKIYEAGRVEHFRNLVIRCNNLTNFLWAFAGVGWSDKAQGQTPPNYLATEDMVFKCHTNSTGMYAYSGVTDTVATINLDTSSANATGTFENAKELVTIRKLIVAERTPTLRFKGCDKLQNIIVDGVIAKSWDLSVSPLTNETVQNIIDHLKDLTGLDSQTLTLKADVGAALTDDQRAAIASKNWTLDY